MNGWACRFSDVKVLLAFQGIQMTTRITRHWRIICITLIALSFSRVSFAAPTANTKTSAPVLFQTSTIQALGLGLYDGDMTFGAVLKHGNLGLGTCQSLDGEVVILGGKVYQLRSDGSVTQVPDTAKTPFAMVTPFEADRTLSINSPLDFAGLQQTLDHVLPTPNIPYAFEITGTFTSITTRSVPVQKRPFPPLAEAVKHQSEFTFNNAQGTLVGFRMPSFLGQVNVPGYHFHFLTADRKHGGHVLKIQSKNIIVQIQYLRNFQLNLPDLSSFDKADFSADQSASIKKAEEAR
jgi:acetolactate decarboxylase